MTTSTTDLVLLVADDNGAISWSFAQCLADLHCLTADFLEEYGPITKGDLVDAGEFLVWLGY
jgi:hypothetical protein